MPVERARLDPDGHPADRGDGVGPVVERENLRATEGPQHGRLQASTFLATSSRSRCFWIFPVAVIGSSSTTSSRSGGFWWRAALPEIRPSGRPGSRHRDRESRRRRRRPARRAVRRATDHRHAPGSRCSPSRSSISLALMFMPPRMTMSLSAAGHPDVTVRVHPTQVAGAREAVGVYNSRGLARGRRVDRACGSVPCRRCRPPRRSAPPSPGSSTTWTLASGWPTPSDVTDFSGGSATVQIVVTKFSRRP